MNLDIIIMIALSLAVFKGIQKGLVFGLFALVSTMLGIIVAYKFTSLIVRQPELAEYADSRLVPMIVFALLVLITILIVRLLGKAIQKLLEVAMLGWLNKLGGIILYAILYSFIISSFLYLIEKVKPEWETQYATATSYPIIKPVAPAIFSMVGAVWPWVKTAAPDIDNFFNKKTEALEQRSM